MCYFQFIYTKPWEISWTEEPGGLYSPWGHKRIRYDLATRLN